MKIIKYLLLTCGILCSANLGPTSQYIISIISQQEFRDHFGCATDLRVKELYQRTMIDFDYIEFEEKSTEIEEVKEQFNNIITNIDQIKTEHDQWWDQQMVRLTEHDMCCADKEEESDKISMELTRRCELICNLDISNSRYYSETMALKDYVEQKPRKIHHQTIINSIDRLFDNIKVFRDKFLIKNNHRIEIQQKKIQQKIAQLCAQHTNTSTIIAEFQRLMTPIIAQQDEYIQRVSRYVKAMNMYLKQYNDLRAKCENGHVITDDDLARLNECMYVENRYQDGIYL